MKNKFLILLSLIVLASLTRLLPHPWNFTPMGGITLMSAALVNNRFKGFVIPFVVWIISDYLVNVILYNKALLDFSYFTSTTALGVYVSMAMIWLVGSLLRTNIRFSTVIACSLLSSIIFYLVSNTFVFIGNSYYSQDVSGWLQCLAMGIPFYKSDYGIVFGSFFFNGIMGDLFYTTFLFSVYSLLVNKSLRLEEIRP